MQICHACIVFIAFVNKAYKVLQIGLAHFCFNATERVKPSTVLHCVTCIKDDNHMPHIYIPVNKRPSRSPRVTSFFRRSPIYSAS